MLLTLQLQLLLLLVVQLQLLQLLSEIVRRHPSLVKPSQPQPPEIIDRRPLIVMIRGQLVPSGSDPEQAVRVDRWRGGGGGVVVVGGPRRGGEVAAVGRRAGEADRGAHGGDGRVDGQRLRRVVVALLLLRRRRLGLGLGLGGTPEEGEEELAAVRGAPRRRPVASAAAHGGGGMAGGFQCGFWLLCPR